MESPGKQSQNTESRSSPQEVLKGINVGFADKFPGNYEQNNPEINIPEYILNLYKIYGYGNVTYMEYLKNRQIFEDKVANSEIKQENQNLLTKTKIEILTQPKEGVASFTMKALENDNIEIQRIGASSLQNVPENQVEKLGKMVVEKITIGLNSQDIQIQRIAINMIQFAPLDEREKLREIVLQKIIEVFNSDDVSKWRIMAKKIKEVPENTQENLRQVVYGKIIEALNSDDIRIQRFAATAVQYAPKDKQTELMSMVKAKFDLAKQEGRFDEMIESSLYIKSDNHKNSAFSHEFFSKTGSETTLLLGKQFKNNLIIRHIEEPCFSVWRKAYESYENWMAAGFDYVPIEPIYSFTYDKKNGLMNVSSGVLDINLEEWYAFSGNTFKEELDRQKNKIIDVLSSLNISHGHENDANFCLRFCRNENGNPDINQIPRIYLIDFDKAIKY